MASGEKCVGGAHRAASDQAKMAVGDISTEVFRSEGLKWASRPVVFHQNTGENVRLSKDSTVATRVKSNVYGIVFTSEPVSTGRMLKVTVTEREPGSRLISGIVSSQSECTSYSSYSTLFSQCVGFTGENPESSTLTQGAYLKWRRGYKQLLDLAERIISYNGKKLCTLDFHTNELTEGQSVGILLTRGRDLHWFVDDQWRGEAHVKRYPLDELTWGVVDVYGDCKKVRAEIFTGESCTALEWCSRMSLDNHPNLIPGSIFASRTPGKSISIAC